MRENEAGRLGKRQQPLLVLEYQVIGVYITRIDRPGPYGRVFQAVGFLVDGEIAIVGGLRVDS